MYKYFTPQSACFLGFLFYLYHWLWMPLPDIQTAYFSRWVFPNGLIKCCYYLLLWTKVNEKNVTLHYFACCIHNYINPTLFCSPTLAAFFQQLEYLSLGQQLTITYCINIMSYQHFIGKFLSTTWETYSHGIMKSWNGLGWKDHLVPASLP